MTLIVTPLSLIELKTRKKILQRVQKEPTNSFGMS